MSLETHFDATFASRLALKEKQIQQNYRPLIGIHKWFARRPGTLFRCLLLAEFGKNEPLEIGYWHAHKHRGVIGDPFMGGGTTLFEANRLGFNVVGTDINPMAYWIVRQSLASLNLSEFLRVAAKVTTGVEKEVGKLYRTNCVRCGDIAEVKYFLWVKTSACPHCGAKNDLFPGYLLAEAVRHPNYVVICAACGELNESEYKPSVKKPAHCFGCKGAVYVEGPVRRQKVECRECGTEFPYAKGLSQPPNHRMWAIEYHCAACKADHRGRLFKRPDKKDLELVREANERLCTEPRLPIPDEEIPSGDETDRLLRWGYRWYRDMFNERQLLGLGLLLQRIRKVQETKIRYALLTVFSDFLRYQNLLCRYDTYALKCQDIFSVHGFPVGLVQCENNLLGIPRVGSGSFRHFVEKYARAKRYCLAPFETFQNGGKKKLILITGETIKARLVNSFPNGEAGDACLRAAPATEMPLPPASLDGVFTDPPYFDNVQYAELMDFCFAWLRLGLHNEITEFAGTTTRTTNELTGNVTLGRGLRHFTKGLSAAFRHFAGALKPGAPFVFTYHYNDPIAYLPVVVATLDAGLDCTATFPAAAEMAASLHIAGTASSVLDSIFVCRARSSRRQPRRWKLKALALTLESALREDTKIMAAAKIRVSHGDLRCLAAGHTARFAINCLASRWDGNARLDVRMDQAREALKTLSEGYDLAALINLTIVWAHDAVTAGFD